MTLPQIEAKDNDVYWELMEVICGGWVGSLKWEMLLLRLDWSATGALVFD
jgi:hypothetical protein